MNGEEATPVDSGPEYRGIELFPAGDYEYGEGSVWAVTVGVEEPDRNEYPTYYVRGDDYLAVQRRAVDACATDIRFNEPPMVLLEVVGPIYGEELPREDDILDVDVDAEDNNGGGG